MNCFVFVVCVCMVYAIENCVYANVRVIFSYMYKDLPRRYECFGVRAVADDRKLQRRRKK